MFREILALTALVVFPAAVCLSVFVLPQFQIKDLVVEGEGPNGSVAQVEQQVDSLKGAHLLRLSIPTLTNRLRALPWLAEVEVRKELPDRLHLKVTEHHAKALLVQAGLSTPLAVLDEDGHRIAIQDITGGLKELPVLEVDSVQQESLARAFSILRVAEMRASRIGPLQSVRVFESGEAFELRFKDLPFGIVVGSDDADKEIERLSHIIPDILGRFQRVNRVDLRYGREIVIELEGQ